jgi:pimeloyl-ACP methyl ester carboxylesterase
MDLPVLDTLTRIYTGGRSFDRALPTVVLIHGAGHDHSVWNHQARHLANHGFGVLAPDLPGPSKRWRSG